MTQKRYIEETNHILWEVKNQLDEFKPIIDDLGKDKRIILQEFMEMLAGVYCYADDLRQYSYKFIQYPSDKNKDRLENHIGNFHQFNDRMKLLDQMVKGNTPDDTENPERRN